MAGKLSPRQKMINLMYLVFIAMLALNMSKEVLSAFGLMNKKLTAANQATTERNNAFLEGLNAKVSDQPEKYGPLQDKATKINDISNQLENYLEGLKTKMKKKVKDTTDYEVMDKPDYLDQLFFRGDKLKPGGKDFLDRINAYRNEMVAILGEDYKEIANSVNANFETETATNRRGKEVEWINHHFEGFPLIASLTKLTQMQTDIKTTKSEVLSAMLEGQLTSDVSLSNYEAIVIPDKTAFFSNENFKGRVVLGRFDNTLSFENVIVNGRKITDLERGQVPLNFPAGNVGTNDIKGELQYMENGELKSIKIETKYAVIPKPNEAIISADKMNVVYRGVQNPMSISIPGIAKINASAQGTLKAASGAGKYTINVTTYKGREIKINASGRLPDGKSVSFNKTFRIKDIPRPVGTVRGEDGNGAAVKMQRNNLAISTIGAVLQDFDFDLKLRVTGFSFKVFGQPTVKVSGQKLNGSAKNALRRAKRGETVQIFDIKAQISGNSGYKLKRVSPVFVELTN